MKIAIYSTHRWGEWGGSEELWCATAESALAAGHDLMLATSDLLTNPKLASLYQSGARSLTFPASHPSGLSLERCVGKARRMMGDRDYPHSRLYRQLSDYAPEHLLINLPSARCLSSIRGLVDWLLNNSIPYTLLLQHATEEPETACLNDRVRLAQVHEKAAACAFVSKRNAENVQRWLELRLDKPLVVRNPVNLRSTEAVLPSSVSNPLAMACVARLDVSHKGHDVLLRTLAEEPWRSRDWRLTLYGEGPHKNFIKNLTAHYRLEDKVVFKGHVSDIREVWRQNHLLVLPSRSEGTPLALVEAMLCGRPAVVTDVAGMCEWVTDGQTGFVANGPDSKSMGAALDAAWQHQSELAAMGAAARQHAIRLYDPDPGRSLLELITTGKYADGFVRDPKWPAA